MAQNILYHTEVKSWHLQETCREPSANVQIHSVAQEHKDLAQSLFLYFQACWVVQGCDLGHILPFLP